MRRAGIAVAAFVAGAVAGGALVLALPVPGVPDGPAPVRRELRLERAEIDTLLAWTPGRLPDGYAEAVRRLPGVARVAVVRSGVVWMDGWTTVSGQAERPPKGYRIPVEVASILPGSYARFVPPADRDAITSRDAVVAGATFAQLHGLGPGATATFGDVRLVIDAVLDDELIGAHEVVVGDALGRRLGVVRPRYLLVAPAGDALPGAVERGLRRLVPPGVRVRVRAPGETPVFRHGDAVLPQVGIKDVFGEFAAVPRSDGTLAVSPGWVEANIRTARVPILGDVRCHRVLLPLLRGALEELVRRGLGHLVDPGDYGGCYYPRFIARDPGATLSRHSWGAAVDINVSEGLTGRKPILDRRVVEVFEDWGFGWGGEWLVPDGAHFEFLRFPSR
jgi:hypothetical protein